MSKMWYDYPYLDFNAYQLQDIGGDTPHAALDFQTPFHTALTTPLAGTVKTADYRDWGGEIFIQPDRGGPEIYWYHPDEVDVHVGEHVDAGQFIGLSGGENPGFPGAEHPSSTTYSSGEHTHFGEFTNFWNTGTHIGTIPFGPDPRPMVDALRSGAPLPITGINTTGTNQTAGFDPTGIGAVWDNIKLNAPRIGFFALGGIVIAAGIAVLIVDKEQIINVAKGVGKVAAL